MHLTKNLLPKSKWEAFTLQVSLSLSLFVLIALWLYFALYPSFYFSMAGGIQGLLLILGVHIVLCPILTLLVFNTNKKKREILSDLGFIILIQLAALIYGLHIVYKERPQLVLIFKQGTATILNAREVAENPKLTTTLQQTNNSIESVAVSLSLADNGQAIFTDPLTNPAVLTQLTQESRRFITQPNELEELKTLESQHTSIYIISMMGKYTGAYIILDPQLKYLGKIGEKPSS